MIKCCLQLRGTIPAAYPSAPHLWWMDFGYNRFTGSIPDSFMCVISSFCMSQAAEKSVHVPVAMPAAVIDAVMADLGHPSLSPFVSVLRTDVHALPPLLNVEP